jgi:periplasmic protein TonB
MGLRCFLFSSDGGSAETIGQVLASLDVQGDVCADAVAAAEKIAHESFQIVIIDWDMQPEAELLLTTARERKASERPITLAIVTDDLGVPKALQAGANSILRRPLAVAQIKDTLTTARDLVRARREPSPAALSAKAAAGTSAPAPLPPMAPKTENTLRAGEFLQSAPVAPGGSFVTESDVPNPLEHPSNTPIDPLKDLEPVAASVAEKAVPLSTPASDEPRGLEWYLKRKGVTRPTAPAAPAPPRGDTPELLGFDQSPAAPKPTPRDTPPAESEQSKEAELFAYIEGNRPGDETPRKGFHIGKGAIFTAFVLASIAIAAAPQAPWHPQMRTFWSHEQRKLHAWLNPQPVTTQPSPAAHESFSRPGDEYKLPAAEAIPDATTDPSQIQVLPVVDPTAKKPTPDTTNPDSNAAQPAPADPSQAGPIEVKEAPVPQTTPEATPSAVAPTGSSAGSTTPVSAPGHAEAQSPAQPPISLSPAPVPRVQAPPRQPNMPGNIPQSIRSQMAPNTPDPGGFKRPDAALPAIEPVPVPENVERSLLIEQPPVQYPSAARGQQGTVVLQVLIGRDGIVQDAKFLQGSLAFARDAIDGVKKWKFKPYLMNGRPVSVQTTVSVSFKP